MKNNYSSVISSREKQDEKAVRGVIALVTAGEAFYQHAIDNVESMLVKRILQDLQSVHKQIRLQLNKLSSKHDIAHQFVSEKFKQAQNWYTERNQLVDQAEQSELLDILVEKESEHLKIVVNTARSAFKPDIKRGLSNAAACYQVAVDYVKSESSQNFSNPLA